MNPSGTLSDPIRCASIRWACAAAKDQERTIVAVIERDGRRTTVQAFSDGRSYAVLRQETISEPARNVFPQAPAGN